MTEKDVEALRDKILDLVDNLSDVALALREDKRRLELAEENLKSAEQERDTLQAEMERERAVHHDAMCGSAGQPFCNCKPPRP